MRSYAVDTPCNKLFILHHHHYFSLTIMSKSEEEKRSKESSLVSEGDEQYEPIIATESMLMD